MPLVKAIVEDIVRQSRLVETLQQRLAARAHASGGGPPTTSIRRSSPRPRTSSRSRKNKLQNYVEELKNLGVELKSDENGLCDFRSMMNGREVYLCWRLGEPEVMFWHELDAGFAGRQGIQPLTPEAEAWLDQAGF